MKTAQSTQFDLLRICGEANCLNGRRVAKELKANSHLWQGFVFGRFEDAPAITLRDISDNDWNADTLLIEPKRIFNDKPDEPVDGWHVQYADETCDALYELAAGWNPAELEWLDGKDASNMIGSYGCGYRVLRVWWD
jgi:hypothetical protein